MKYLRYALLTLFLFGCATDPTVKYAVAVTSYTTAIEVATPIVAETVTKGDISRAEVNIVQSTFEAARVVRNGAEDAVRECEQHRKDTGDEDCPQGALISVAADNVDDLAKSVINMINAIKAK